MQMCIIHYFSDVPGNLNAGHCRPLIQDFLNLARVGQRTVFSKYFYAQGMGIDRILLKGGDLPCLESRPRA